YETLTKEDVEWIMEGKPIDEKRSQDNDKARKKEAARKLAEADAMGRKNRAGDSTSGTGVSSDPNPKPA
ncbi:MAG: hypothetical protein L6Q71_05030, partial [Planctomycetes bacterium]|nr:hypothetical protein [Planctomycetota bacterium]